MQRILVVEDEMQIARNIRDYLEVAGFEVTVVGDGSAALASARGDRPDLVVLDLGLPGVDGLDVARELRRTATTPIVMLTARGEVLRAGDVEIDLPKMRARVAGRAVDLTPTEFQLLVTLVREPGRVFTRGQLLDALHGVTL